MNKLLWLQHNLPVFIQPQFDIRQGNSLRAVFVDFTNDYVDVSVVYDGEASYNRYHKSVLNVMGSLIYRTFNMLVYGRTADVESLIYDTRHHPTTWDMIYVRDGNGEQNWNNGDILKLSTFSIFHHYKTTIWRNNWTLYPNTTRPIVYSNTCNHLHGPIDMNPELDMYVSDTYPVYEGNRKDAERFGQTHCRIDFNLITCCRRQKEYFKRLHVWKTY